MEYKRYGSDIVVRLDPGEELTDQLKEVVEKEKIGGGWLNGMGSSSELETMVYDVDEKKFYKKQCFQPAEIVDMMGVISRKDDISYLDIHIIASALDGTVIGGHLNYARTASSMIVLLHPLEGELGRKYNAQTGLTFIKF